MRQKGTFFPPLVLRWRKPEKGQKSVMIEEFFEIFFKKILGLWETGGCAQFEKGWERGHFYYCRYIWQI